MAKGHIPPPPTPTPADPEQWARRNVVRRTFGYPSEKMVHSSLHISQYSRFKYHEVMQDEIVDRF